MGFSESDDEENYMSFAVGKNVKTMNAFDQGKVVKDSGVELVREVAKPFEKTDQIEESEMDVLPQDEVNHRMMKKRSKNW
jgi:hypothetical protein